MGCLDRYFMQFQQPQLIVMKLVATSSSNKEFGGKCGKVTLRVVYCVAVLRERMKLKSGG